ncbi:MAG: transcription termination factor Rho [Tissierellia bacterium]|nr:transcription termination factor Rho [Tissierellia bacterium]
MKDKHSLSQYSLTQLRELGKEKGIPGYYRLKKDELIDLIQDKKSNDREDEKESLQKRTLLELRDYAEELGLEKSYSYKKDDLIDEILKLKKYKDISDDDYLESEEDYEEIMTPDEDQELVIPKDDIDELSDNATEIIREMDQKTYVTGILDLHPDGFGFLRVNNYTPGEGDIYVAPTQIRRFRLKNGDMVTGLTRPSNGNESDNALIYIKEVNGHHPGECLRRRTFEKLTPIYPIERYQLEQDSKDFTTRIIDLISPIGKGQRGLIVSQPKSGKTTLLKKVANSISKNYPDSHLMVLLIDERPEEVTDMQRSVNGEVIYSTFDETPKNHARVAEIALERGKRLVEEQKDVVILLDSLTRLARAYNLITPPSGKTLSGGLDPLSLHKPKRFFGAARKVEEGGSLTILATALVETGSRMDDVIFEEFKGTGNMEVHLDRKLSERRIFPAIDIYKSGTRREDLLLNQEEYQYMLALRQAMSNASTSEITEALLENMDHWETNKDLMKNFPIRYWDI